MQGYEIQGLFANLAKVANAITTQDAMPGPACYSPDGQVGSLTEAVMDHTRGLQDIASALREVAEAIRESKNCS